MKQLILPAMMALCITAYGKENVRIHGKIIHPLSDSITATPSVSVVPYQPDDHVAILHNGEFTLELNVPTGFTEVRLLHGNQETHLMVQPGANLTITLDADNFDSTLHYEGKGKELANFMAKRELEEPMMQQIAVKGQSLCSKDKDEFEQGLKKLEDIDLDFLKRNGKGLPPGFVAYFKAEVRYDAYSVMAKYPWLHEMIKEKKMSVQHIPKENYEVVNDIPEDFNDAYINMSAYNAYVTNVFYGQIIKSEAEDTTLRVPADTTYTLAYKRMPPKTAEYYVADRIFQDTKAKPMDTVKKALDGFKKHFPHSKYVAVLQQAISFQQTMATGKPAIDFDISTPEGRHMKLSGLKGNVVYLDFWSSGCMPCLAEMSVVKKIKEHFKDKPVKFVYVSLDPDDSAWKTSIERYHVEGVNMHVDKMYQSELIKKYGVYGIPTYFLVDKDGKFADANDVARPSSTDRLIAQIEKLLK